MSPVDSNWNVMFRLTGDSAGVATNALSIVDNESKIDQLRIPQLVCSAFSQ
ncbi:MAG: hypothetical protein ACJZ39_05105 [Candidatus Thalassarchaeaceae archaeon]